MSTTESLKRAQTLLESANIAHDHLTRIHDFLFGAMPEGKTDRDIARPPSSSSTLQLPYFMNLINIQSQTDQVLNRTHDLLGTIAAKLEMSNNSAAPAMPGRTASMQNLDRDIDRSLNKFVDSMKGSGIGGPVVNS